MKLSCLLFSVPVLVTLHVTSSCTKEKQTQTYALITADTAIAVNGNITITEKTKSEVQAKVHIQDLWMYEGELLNNHIHEGSYPNNVGAVKYDFGKQKVTNGEVNATLNVPLSFAEFKNFDAVFVIHKPDNVLYLATVEIGK